MSTETTQTPSFAAGRKAGLEAAKKANLGFLPRPSRKDQVKYAAQWSEFVKGFGSAVRDYRASQSTWVASSVAA